jgi:hypothetical protein
MAVRLPAGVAPWQPDRLTLVFHANQFLSGMVDIICSESAVIVRLGFTPRFAETTDPATTMENHAAVLLPYHILKLNVPYQEVAHY